MRSAISMESATQDIKRSHIHTHAYSQLRSCELAFAPAHPSDTISTIARTTNQISQSTYAAAVGGLMVAVVAVAWCCCCILLLLTL